MLVGLLYVLFILACVILIATVLLQPGKTDAGALFTSNISSTAFGPRGTQTILSKITIGAAAAFMIIAFLLSQPGLTGNRSVLETTTVDPSTTETEQQQQQPSTNVNNQAGVPSASPQQNEAAANNNVAPETNVNQGSGTNTNK